MYVPAAGHISPAIDRSPVGLPLMRQPWLGKLVFLELVDFDKLILKKDLYDHYLLFCLEYILMILFNYR
jgi:hypothetical protein